MSSLLLGPSFRPRYIFAVWRPAISSTVHSSLASGQWHRRSLSAENAAAWNQARIATICFDRPFLGLDFVNNHSVTIVILIKYEVEGVSLAVVQELQLIVTLCGSVLPNVPQADLVSSDHLTWRLL